MHCVHYSSHRPARGVGGDCILLATALGCQLGPHLVMSHHVEEENEHTLQRQERKESASQLAFEA